MAQGGLAGVTFIEIERQGGGVRGIAGGKTEAEAEQKEAACHVPVHGMEYAAWQ
jgi:hypothetical protein